MTPEVIAKRARRLRITDKELGDLAGCAENTVNRTLTGKTRPLLETATAMDAALMGEELGMRNYLLTLYPLDRFPLPAVAEVA